MYVMTFKGLDVLLTHGPLPQAVLAQLRPRLHISGHIHRKYGVSLLDHGTSKTICVNASIMDGKYHPTHVPVVVDVPADVPAAVDAMPKL